MSIVWRALDLDRVELLVLDKDVGALADLVALDLLFVFDRLARLGVDVLALHTIAGLAVERVEKRTRAEELVAGIQRDRARDEGQLQVSLPVGARRHSYTPTKR